MLCVRVCVRVQTCMDGDEWACGSVKINKAWRAWNLECSGAAWGSVFGCSEDSLSPSHFNIIGRRQHS